MLAIVREKMRIERTLAAEGSSRLSAGISLCYKAYMRKWMRERLKRRKKADPKAEDSKTRQAPLQPAYFEAREKRRDGSELKQMSRRRAKIADEGFTLNLSDTEPGNSIDDADRGQQAMHPAAEIPRKRSADAEVVVVEVAVADGKHGLASGGCSLGCRRRRGTAVPRPQPTPEWLRQRKSRPPKGVVVLAIGLPGSGKSSWFKRHSITPLSSDMLRALLFDDAQEQRFQDLVFSNLRSMLKARLIARRPTNYVDATNLTPQERQNWVKLAKDYGYEAQAVFFDVPLDVCLERNQKRNRAVEEEAMRRMSGKLRPPTFEEGFYEDHRSSGQEERE